MVCPFSLNCWNMLIPQVLIKARAVRESTAARVGVAARRSARGLWRLTWSGSHGVSHAGASEVGANRRPLARAHSLAITHRGTVLQAHSAPVHCADFVSSGRRRSGVASLFASAVSRLSPPRHRHPGVLARSAPALEPTKSTSDTAEKRSGANACQLVRPTNETG